MPRDMFAFQPDEDNSLTLTRSPDSQSSMTSSQGVAMERPVHKDVQSLTGPAQLRSKGANISARNDLHPYVQTLSLADVDSCVALENAAFPENERCSREKVGGPALVPRSFDSTPSVQWSACPNGATAKAQKVAMRPHLTHWSSILPGTR